MGAKDPPTPKPSLADALERAGRGFDSLSAALGGPRPRGRPLEMVKAPTSDFFVSFRFAVSGSSDDEGLEAADSVARLGGDGEVPVSQVDFDGRRLELRAGHRRGVRPLAERLAGVRWVRVEAFDRGRRSARRFTFVAEEGPRPLLELDAAADSVAIDGAVWVEAELVAVEDFDQGKGKEP